MATTHLGFCIKCNSSYIGWEHQCSFPSQPNSKGRHWCSNDCFKCGNFTPEDAIKVSTPGEVNKCEKCHGLKIPNDGKFLCNCPCHSKDSIQGNESIQIQAITEKDGIFYLAIKTTALKDDLEVVTQKYIKELISKIQKEERERIAEYIANYTVDLCENSQQFKSDISKFLSDNN